MWYPTVGVNVPSTVVIEQPSDPGVILGIASGFISALTYQMGWKSSEGLKVQQPRSLAKTFSHPQVLTSALAVGGASVLLLFVPNQSRDWVTLFATPVLSYFAAPVIRATMPHVFDKTPQQVRQQQKRQQPRQQIRQLREDESLNQK